MKRFSCLDGALPAIKHFHFIFRGLPLKGARLGALIPEIVAITIMGMVVVSLTPRSSGKGSTEGLTKRGTRVYNE